MNHDSRQGRLAIREFGPLVPVATGETANDVWLGATRWFNDASAPLQAGRGGPTSEQLHTVLAIANPRERWIPSRRPALNPAFAIAEVVWILAGRADAAMLTFFNPRLPEFAGHAEEYHGAYGYRLRSAFGFDQLERAAEALSHNPASRQVVLQIWDAAQDFPDERGRPVSQDIPCNVISLLKIRGGRLHWTQILRSNDLVLGLPHNIVQFTFLQEVLAGWLDLEMGSYTQLSDSLHVYENNLADVRSVSMVRPQPNSDSIALSRDQSVVAWADLERRAYIMAAPELTRADFERVLDADDAPVSFKNLLAILCADAARRHGWDDLSERSVQVCENPALLQLWDRWARRVSRKR